MTSLNLSAPQAALLAAALVVVGTALRVGGRRRRLLGRVAPYLFESAVIAVLYAAWQWLAALGHSRLGTAVARGEGLLRLEHEMRLPSEHDVQQLVLGHPLVVQGANLYYAVAHFTGMGLLLVWLFVRHRDRYPAVRTTLVLVTAACLAIQFVAVAPPRLLPGAGFVDTAARYGQSVYGSLSSDQVSTLLGVDFGADQLSAMPSVHVAWALLVAIAVQTASRSRYRAVIWLHPVLTVFVVVATANHYWLDGVVAALLLAAAGAITVAFGRRRARAKDVRGARVTATEPGTSAPDRISA